MALCHNSVFMRPQVIPFSFRKLECQTSLVMENDSNDDSLGQAILPFFLLLFLCLVSVAMSETDPNDMKVLNDIRNGLENADLLNWPVQDDDACGPPLWPHVYCFGNRVTQIQVQNLGLKGPLPQSLNQLKMLSNLGLQGNKFNSKLPSFTGLSKLEYAYLNDNEFDTIPFDFFDELSSIRVIALDHNPLNKSTGWFVPNDLQKMALLANLSMVDCNLVGQIPEFLGALPSLSVLKLSYNRLSGRIPLSFAQSVLQILWVNDQAGEGMSGSVDVVATMKSLTQLWLHGNKFTREVPEGIGSLVMLKDLNLNRNQLVGTIPESLASMELEKLDLDHNMFCGSVPKFKSRSVTYAFNSFCETDPGVACSSDVMALLSFLKAVKYPVDLASRWSGSDPCHPPWFGLSCSSASKVSVLSLSGLGLTGELSSSLAMLDTLTEIRLRGNHLSGNIPMQLTALRNLRLLDIGRNNLEPPLPAFSQNVEVITDGNPFFLVDNHTTPYPSPSPPVPLQPSNGSPSGSQSAKSPLSLNPSTVPRYGSNSSRPIESDHSNSKRHLLLVIVAAVSASSLSLLIAALLVLYRCKKMREATESSAARMTHNRDPSGLENDVEVSEPCNEPEALRSVENNFQRGNRTMFEKSHVIHEGNVVISIQVLRPATPKA